MIKLNFRISKLNNLFSFVSCLSKGGENAYISKRNQEWLGRIGALTKQDEALLNSLSLILKQADFHIEPVLLTSSSQEFYEKLKKEFGQDKTKQIKKTLNHFSKRFDIIWSWDKVKMDKITLEIRERKAKINLIIGDILKLCGLTQDDNLWDIKIHFFLSSNHKSDRIAWTSWMPHDSSIILECSGWPQREMNELAYSILPHEYFHLILRKNKELFSDLQLFINRHNKLVKNIGVGDMDTGMIFEEILISSFLPEGYLSEKHLGFNVKKRIPKILNSKKINLLARVRYEYALLLYDMAKEYVNGDKILDDGYFEEIISGLQKNIRKKKGK